MLNLVALILLVTTSADWITAYKFGQSCYRPGDCNELNAECDYTKKVCFCEPGYGIDYETKDTTCRKFPLRKVKTVKFEQGIDLDCMIYGSNISQINWFRDGTPCTQKLSCFQDCEIQNSKSDSFFRKRLRLLNVVTNHTYTCQALTNEGMKWTVAEYHVQVGIKFEMTSHVVSGSNSSIFCGLEAPESELQIRLVRDDEDICTPDATWCTQLKRSKKEIGNYLWFEVSNLQADHTFTCEAYKGDVKQATTSVFHFVIGDNARSTGTGLIPRVSYPKENPDFDAEYYFGNSVAARLRTLNEKNKAMLMIDMQQLLFKYEFEMNY